MLVKVVRAVVAAVATAQGQVKLHHWQVLLTLVVVAVVRM
jgi:hypothetical protein